jgi:hypothetical protein
MCLGTTQQNYRQLATNIYRFLGGKKQVYLPLQAICVYAIRVLFKTQLFRDRPVVIIEPRGYIWRVSNSHAGFMNCFW